MKKIYALTLIFLLLILTIIFHTCAHAQTTFEKTSHGIINITAAIQDVSNNFVFAGYYGGPVPYVLKTDSAGNVLWALNVGFSNSLPHGITQTEDSGYIVSIESYGYNLAKLDKNGGVVWGKQIASTGTPRNVSIASTFDHGFLVTGYIDNLPSHPSLMFVAKIDSLGNKIWAHTYVRGATLNESFRALELPDHTTIVIGSSSDPTQDEAYILKLDYYGSLIWSKSYYQFPGIRFSDLVIDWNKIYVLYNSQNAAGIMRIDTSGAVLWTRSCPQICGKNLHLLPDKSFLINCDNANGMVCKIDSVAYAAVVYTGTAGSNVKSISEAIHTNDGGYLIVANNSRFSILKTDSAFNTNGCLSAFGVLQFADDSAIVQPVTFTINTLQINDYFASNINANHDVLFPGCSPTAGVDELTDHGVIIFPNPSSGEINLQFSSEKNHILIHDAIGRIVYDERIFSSQLELNLNRGFYFITVDNGVRVLKEKIIVE